MPDPVADFPAADVLAIAAHRDDVEQTCGGTLLRMASRGLRTAILDLTQGEAGTRGTAEERAEEAAQAARLLCVGWRQALDLADGAVDPAFRRWGVHRALLDRRCADAAEAGAEVVFSGADYLGASSRNMIRKGLGVLYTKAIWTKR